MANKLKGEVALQVGDKTVTLLLDINSIVEIETLLDTGIAQIIEMLSPERVRLGTLRAILWGALRRHHPEVTILGAGDLIGEVGAEAVGEKIGEALKAAFPESDGAENPPKAA